jgi:hypothetical protein
MNSKQFLSLNFLAIVFLIFGISACTITDEGEDPFMEFSNFSFGDKKIEFKSARLTITGPINFSSTGSHVWAKLDLSTDEKFSQISIANSSLMSIVIHSVPNGKTLPEFPLQSGEYIVYPSLGVSEPSVIAGLEGKNFSFGPSIGFNYFPDELNFKSLHDAAEGKIIILFDFEKNRVNITHNWISKDGVKATGTNNLPLNLSSFNP